MLPKRRYKNWCVKVLVLTSIFMSVGGLFNIFVDPFGLYNWFRLEGINANKHAATKHTRLVKSYLLHDLGPGALILGSSRAEIGIDPEHMAWRPEVKPVLNLGVAGASIREVRQLLEMACRREPPKQVVLGVDLFMFNAYRQEDAELAEPSVLKRVSETVLAASTLKASADTLLKQDPIRYPGYLPNGQIAWTYDLSKIRRYGHREAFLRNARKYFENHYFPPPEHKFDLSLTPDGNQPLDHFSAVLRLARENRIDLRLFISPVHAWQLLIIEQAGLWAEFETWKRRMVEMVAADARRHPGQRAFPLWDFSGFNQITTEPLPALGDTSTLMAHYWESSHYRKEAGDLVLRRILDEEGADPVKGMNFGILVIPATIERHLAAIRFGLAEYRRQYPEAVFDIARMKAEVTFLKPGPG